MEFIPLPKKDTDQCLDCMITNSKANLGKIRIGTLAVVLCERCAGELAHKIQMATWESRHEP